MAGTSNTIDPTDDESTRVPVSTTAEQTIDSRVDDSLLCDPLAQSCSLCNEFDTVDMVRCDSETCKKWFHFVCVGVVREEVEAVEWKCTECKAKRQDDSKSIHSLPLSITLSSKSESRSSSVAKRKHLALKRIEEERRLKELRDQEYLNKKYATLEDWISSDSDGERVKSVDEALTSRAKLSTSQWVHSHTGFKGDEDDMLNERQMVSAKPSENSKVIPSTVEGRNSPRSMWKDLSNCLRECQDELVSGIRAFGAKDMSGGSRLIGNSSSSPAHTNSSSVVISENNAVSQSSVRYSRPSILKSSGERDTTYSVFTNQAPINSSIVQSYGNSGHGLHSKQYTNSSHQVRFGSVNPHIESVHGYQSQENQIPRDHFTFQQEPSVHSSNVFNKSYVPPHLFNDPIVSTSTTRAENSTQRFAGGDSSSYVGSNTGGNTDPSNRLLGNSSKFQPQETFMNTRMERRSGKDFTLDGRTSSRLDANQIAARQAMPKTLPTFRGSPEEWPVFLSAYENSTNACGYSNSENLGRLLECLKGEALDAVRCILLHPDSVPEAMQTLEMMFGRPELIIEALLEDLRKEPAPKENDLNALVKFALKVRNLVATIRSFGPLDHLQNPLLVKSLVDKLPTQTRINWAYFKSSHPLVNLAGFGDWLYSLAQVTSQVVGRQKIESSKKDRKDVQRQQSPKINHVNAQVDGTQKDNVLDSNSQAKSSNQGVRQCPICSLESCKQIHECRKFRSMTPADRWNEVKGKRLCYSCFGKHRHFKCRSRKKCQVNGCQLTHHVLLHDNERQSTSMSQRSSNASAATVTTTNPSNGGEETLRNLNSLQTKRSPAVYRIAPVVLHAKKKTIHTFAYLDDGSDLELMERDLVKELGIIGTPDVLKIRWAFKNTDEQTDSEIVSIRISGDFKCAPIYKLDNVYTVDKLFLPSQSITKDWLESYPHLRSLPISTYEEATPRILIGLQGSKLTVSQETVEGAWNEPVACRTRLGWTVQGPDESDASERITRPNVSLNICECHADNQLHQLVKEFFCFENLGTRGPEKLLESKESARAREILESTTVKKNGRYETGLLWRSDDIYLPDSYGMALKRLNCLENKMKKDVNLAQKLCDQMEDFVNKKYIRKLLPHEIEEKSSRTWYLPIFVVFNPKKPLKFRTVWDAAAKVKNVSLNSVLLKGPDQLVPLPDVLRRFRERLYAVTGDIGEMFHRVGVIEKDRCAQRFLWRDGQSNRQPDVYVMEVLTFGSASSPSSAQFVKNKNALEFQNRFPRAVEAIIENTYMDDMLDCSDTQTEAIRLVKDVQFVHQQASFEFGKITSNSSEILQALGVADNQEVKNLNLSTELVTERVLGMYWNAATDMFTFSLRYAKIDELVMTGERNPTKREVLRALMSIFDPLGLIANVLVFGKILLQQIWRKGTDWDEQISGNLLRDWMVWIQWLPKVESIEIPRLYSPKLSPKRPTSIQMHTFVDASIEACAAVTYFRYEDEFGVDCNLAGAKTKVAPNKPMTVPRLELQAAVLGTRLAGSVGQSQRFKIDKRIYWSDSQTVLSWIMSETRKYNQFVAFRVGEILENSAEEEWNWVSTIDNVADEATKSKNQPDISSSSRWFKGPSFLYGSEGEWNNVIDKAQYTTDEELRPRHFLAQFVGNCENVIDPNKFSNWRRMHRTLTYALRFIHNVRNKNQSRLTGPLTRMELVRSENRLYQQAQRFEFVDEIAIIRHNFVSPMGKWKSFDKGSLLRECSPFLDECGTLRMRSRTDLAESLPIQAKRPIILPRDHKITKLVVLHYHQKFHHRNHQTTLNEIHKRFFIPSLRRALKSVIHNECQRCKNDRSNPKVPEMADLPPARIATYHRPFSFVGIDYFGPYWVKVNTTKRKRWGVLVTCLTTRAIHIEVAEALTTSECIMAIRRFIGRRGTPIEYYSDNGTNFHGSERELRTEFEKLNVAEIQEAFTDSVSQWRFNPPAAPHMGGSWERMIQTVKSILKKTMPTRTPTQKMFETYLIEAEYIINSRPLTYVHLDHREDDVLTPNHFLVGQTGGVRTPGKLDETSLLRDDWKAVQHMTDLFWRCFNVEYLPTLTRRTKWFQKVKPIEVGDVVIVVDDKHERNNWPKGIVVETFPGKGGAIRSARIRLVRGRNKLATTHIKNIKHQSLIRPVAKLAILDVKNEELKASSGDINGRKNVENHTGRS